MPPTIPTSFVPKQPVQTMRRPVGGGHNLFLIIAFFAFILAVLGSGATFGYQYYLEGVAKAKANQLEEAQKSVDASTVEQFIRLRDRFAASKDLLNNHVALSQFFDLLETMTLTGVRFNSLKVIVGTDRVASVEMAGVAKNFNALAAQSAAFTGESRIKRAIFSGITVNKDGTVMFKLRAELDPKLVVFSSAPAVAPSVLTPTPTPTPATTTTATTTP